MTRRQAENIAIGTSILLLVAALGVGTLTVIYLIMRTIVLAIGSLF